MIQSRPGNSASLLGIALLAIPLLFLFSTITVAPCSAKHHIPELYVVDGGGDEWPETIAPPDGLQSSDSGHHSESIIQSGSKSAQLDSRGRLLASQSRVRPTISGNWRHRVVVRLARSMELFFSPAGSGTQIW